MPSSFWNTALEEEALLSWARVIIMEQLLTVCAWHPKGMPGKCLYTLAIAIALLSYNKAFLLIFEEQMLIRQFYSYEFSYPLMMKVLLH